jgi:hypothetical protein
LRDPGGLSGPRFTAHQVTDFVDHVRRFLG